MGQTTAKEGSPGRAAIAGSVGLIVLIWALNFIAAKIGVRYLPALALASFRVVLAAVLMVPAYLLGADTIVVLADRVLVETILGERTPAPTTPAGS